MPKLMTAPESGRANYTFTVAKYHEMLDTGILPEKFGLELIEGALKMKNSGLPFRITVEKYSKLIRAGILNKDDRVELFRGWIVKQMAINPPHSSAATRLARWLLTLALRGWVIRLDQPINLAAVDSMPEPDGAIVRGDDSLYDQRHPVPADFGVLIEVADSSLAENRSAKAIMYAECMIPEYWIVNVAQKQIEVYTQPSGPVESPVYANRKDYPLGSSLALILDGTTLATLKVDDIMPR